MLTFSQIWRLVSLAFGKGERGLTFMLKSISSDQDYLNHLHLNLNTLDTSQKKRLSQPLLKSALHKLKKLRIDLVSDLLHSLYSSIGKPCQ